MQTENTPSVNTSMYFVALAIPEPVASAIMKIKQEFAENYNSKKPLNSPAHLTLITPFYFKDSDIPLIEKPLADFSALQKKLTLHLSGFGAFPPKTIFVDLEANEQLLLLYKELSAFVNDNMQTLVKYIPANFTPHITVGNRDLTKENFKKAWTIFEKRPFDKAVEIDRIVIYRHNGTRWETFKELPFDKSMSRMLTSF